MMRYVDWKHELLVSNSLANDRSDSEIGAENESSQDDVSFRDSNQTVICHESFRTETALKEHQRRLCNSRV